MRRVRRPCAPASSALPKPMEGALCSGAVTERPAGAAGEKAAGDIMVNISKGSKSEGRQGRSGINWEGSKIYCNERLSNGRDRRRANSHRKLLFSRVRRTRRFGK